MRRALRCTLRLPALCSWLVLCWLVWVLGRTLLAPFPAAARRWREARLRGWAAGTCRLLGLTVEIRGRPVRPPVLLAANHVSWTDIPVLLAARPAALLSKREVLYWPLVGQIAWSVGTLFVARGRKRALPGTARAIARRLERGEAVAFFPEGTTGPGDRPGPFHPGLFDPAAALGLPVQPVALAYERPAAGPDPAWLGGEPFLVNALRLLGAPQRRVSVRFGEALRAPDRKRLAARAEAACAALLAS